MCRSMHWAPTAVAIIIRQHTRSYKPPNRRNNTSSMKKSCSRPPKLNLNLIECLDSMTSLEEYREQRKMLYQMMGLQPPNWTGGNYRILTQ